MNMIAPKLHTNGAQAAGERPARSKADLQHMLGRIPLTGNANIADEDLDFVHDARALLKGRRRKTRSWTPWVSVAVVGLFFWWASWAEIDEVTRGQGKVIPSKSVQIIQSLEGGILEEIYVEEGQKVEAGQDLVRIRDAIFSSSYQENLSRRDMLEARLIRLKAEAENTPEIKFPEGVRADLTGLERQLFEKRRTDWMTAESALLRSLKLVRQEEELLKGGTASKAISMVELIRSQKESAKLEGDLRTLHTTFERLAMEQFDKDRVEYESLVHAIKRDKDRLDRTVIKSKVRGVVNKIDINTVGRVVASGADIMSIVPTDDTLLIEANIKPSDIAFIRPGEMAKVKFTAYDFSIYGGLDGQIERIGVDTVTDVPGHPGRASQPLAPGQQQNASYYPITVRTDKNSLGRDNKGQELSIIPGMVAEVDILTGKKTVLNYLLMPLNRGKERALRER